VHTLANPLVTAVQIESLQAELNCYEDVTRPTHPRRSRSRSEPTAKRRVLFNFLSSPWRHRNGASSEDRRSFASHPASVASDKKTDAGPTEFTLGMDRRSDHPRVAMFAAGAAMFVVRVRALSGHIEPDTRSFVRTVQFGSPNQASQEQ